MFRRNAAISRIKVTLNKAKLEGLEVDRSKMILMIMGEHFVARRTAREYYDTAEGLLLLEEKR